MYWILSNEIEDMDTDADLSGTEEFISSTGLEFDDGISLEKFSVPALQFVINDNSTRGRMTDHLSIAEVNGPVFSSRIRTILQLSESKNIEYFDLEIHDPKKNKTYQDYKLANIVGIVDCIDTEQSDLKYYPNGDIKRIWRLVLNEDKIPSKMKVFRLAKYKLIIVVHDEIKKAFDREAVTGCVFYRPEDYD